MKLIRLREFALIFSMILVVIPISGHKIVIVDGVTNTKLPSVTVLSKGGSIAAISDINGECELRNEDFPAMVKCIGYKPSVIDDNIAVCILEPEVYDLPEVTISSDRPITRMVAFVRELTTCVTSRDTLCYIAEHVGDFYFKNQPNVKKFKGNGHFRPLKSFYCQRISDADGKDSVTHLSDRQFIFGMLGDIVQVYDISCSVSEEILKGAKRDTENGKYYPKRIDEISGNSYRVFNDMLSDKKNHVFSPNALKLFGLTTDFKKMQMNCLFSAKDSDGEIKKELKTPDLISMSYSSETLCRGKWIKKFFNTDSPVELNFEIEIVPIRCEYLSVEQANDEQKNSPSEDFLRSPNATPLHPLHQSIVDRAALLPTQSPDY